MEEKKLLGIAYILSIIPVLNIVGLILLILGWIKLGNKYNENLWKWVGYSAILAIIASILAFATLMGSIFAMAAGILDVSAVLSNFLVLAPVLLLSLVYAILQLIGLWKAGTKFNSGLLKAASILSIIIPPIGYLLAAIAFLTLKEK
ncbi:MAG: hypothetical protein QXX07_03895 [Candidatus Aenigmatarchaeota archaeon]